MACVGGAPTFNGTPTLASVNCVNTISCAIDEACGSSGYQVEFYRDTSGGFGSETLINTQSIPAGPLTASSFSYIDTPPCLRGNYFYRVKITCAGVVQSTAATAPASAASGGPASITASNVTMDGNCTFHATAQISKPCGECAGHAELFRNGVSIYSVVVPAGPLIGFGVSYDDSPGDGVWSYIWKVYRDTGAQDDQSPLYTLEARCNLARYNPNTTALPSGMEKQIVLVNVTRGGTRGYVYTDYRVLNLQEQRAEWWIHKNGGCGAFRFLTHDQFPEIVNDTSTADSWELHVRIKLAGETVYTTWYRGIVRSVKVEEQGNEQYSDVRGYGYVELLDNVQVQKQYVAGLTVKQVVDDIIETYIKPNTRIRRPSDVDVTNANSGVDASSYVLASPVHFECSALKALKFLAELQGNREFGVDASGYIYFRATISTIIYNFFLSKDIVKKISGGKTFIQANELKVAGKSFGGRDYLQVRPDVTDISYNGVYESTVEVPWVTGDKDASTWADNIIAKNKVQQKWSVFTWKGVSKRLDASNPIGRVTVYGDDISNNVDTYDIAKIQYVEGGWITKQELRDIGSPTIQPELDQQLLKATFYVGYYPRDIIEEIEVRLREQIEFLKGRHKQFRYPNDVSNLIDPVTNQAVLGKLPGELKHFRPSPLDPTNYDLTNNRAELQDLTNPRGVMAVWLDKQYMKLALARTFNGPTIAGLPTRGKYIGEIVALITDITQGQFGDSYIWSGTTWTKIGAASSGGGGGTGTVTSVALTAPAEISVAGSPITTAGTLALTWATQAANLFFAGPTSGGSATPAFRAMVAADIPAALSISITSLTLSGSLTMTGLQPNRIVYTNSTKAFTSGFFHDGTSTGIGTGTPRRIVDILDATNPQLRLSQQDNVRYVDFQTNSSGYLQISASSARVGINCNPDSLLEIRIANATYWGAGGVGTWSGSTIPAHALTVTNSNNSGYDATIIFRMATSIGTIKTAGAIDMTGTASWTDGVVSSQISDMLFITRNNADVLVERMRIAANGYVGIFTTLPSAKLDIFDVTNQLRLSYSASVATDLNTNSSGYLVITPTGKFVGINITPTDVLHVANNVTNVRPTFENTATSNAVNDVGLMFNLKNASGTSTLYGGLICTSSTITAGNEETTYGLYTKTGGVGYAGMKVIGGFFGFGLNPIPRVTVDVWGTLRLTQADNTVYTNILTNASGYLTITPTGERVGINTTPGYTLHVQGSSNTYIAIASSGVNSLDRGIVFTNQAGAAAGYITLNPNTIGTNAQMYFYIGGGATADVKLNIHDDGFVAVNKGATTASRMLEIVDPTTTAQVRITYTAATVYTDLFTNVSGHFYILPTGSRVGINGQPSTHFDIIGNTLAQLRLTYTAFTVYTNFTVNAAGELAINASGGTVTCDAWLRVGTTTDPIALGDFGAGVLGASRLYWGRGASSLYLYDASGTVQVQWATGADSFNRGGKTGFMIATPNVTVDVNGGFATRGITPTQLTGNTNDFTFTGGSQSYSFQRVSTSVALTISGFSGGFDGKHLFIANVGLYTIYITNEDINSSAANRVLTGTANTITIAQDQVAHFIYDATVSRWRLISVGAGTNVSSAFGTTSPNQPIISMNPFMDLNDGRVLVGTPDQIIVTDNGVGDNTVQISLADNVKITGPSPLILPAFSTGAVLYMSTGGLVTANIAKLYFDSTLGGLAIGTSPALTGSLRIPNNTYLTTAGPGINNADIQLIGMDNSGVSFGKIVIGNGASVITELYLNSPVLTTTNMSGTSIINTTPNAALGWTSVYNRVSFGFAGETVDGFTGGIGGRILIITNAGATNTATIVNESAFATAANRIVTGTGGNITWGLGQTLAFIYDAGDSRWRIWKNA